MNIAFDLDGVIFPIEDFQITEGKKFFGSDSIYDINGYGIKEVFNCTEDDEIKFWLKNTFKFNRNVLATNGIKKIIDNLRKNGHKVYILTSRAKANENNLLGQIMRNEINHALKRNNIEVDGIIYTSTKNSEIDKYNSIKKYNIHIMIDDKKENINAIKNITNTIMFHTKNNADYVDDSVIRVSNATELEVALNKIITNFNKLKVNVLNYQEINEMTNKQKLIYFYNLRQMYYSLREPFSLEKGENGCRKIIGSMQKIYNLLYKPNVLHKEKFPQQKGIILVSNHLHSFDPLLIMSQANNVSFHLLAKQELLDNKLWNYLFTSIGSFFVDNENAISRRTAKESLIKTVLNGGTIMMYPEGTRNRTEKELLDFHMGAVSIAQITGAPIYPFAVNSDYKIFNNNLCLAVGEPIYITETDDLVEKNAELKNIISQLISEIKVYETDKRLKLCYPKK